MNILQDLIGSQGGDVVGQLAQQFGISKDDAQKALSNLIPAVAGGVKKTAANPSGLESLLSKVKNNQDLRQAADNPSVLGQPQTVNAGNDILGDIFGSKDVSRTVAGHTAKSTGIDVGILKKMLPMVAGLVMSQLNNKSQSSGGGLGELLGGLAGGRQASSSSGGLLGGLLGGRSAAAPQKSSGLESLLDFDGDGNISDDMLDLVKKMF